MQVEHFAAAAAAATLCATALAEVAEQQTGCVTVAGGRKGAELLKAVEKALKLCSRGLPMTCENGADRQQA